ncbi:MAG: HK97 family phage prohead protease [Clostridia bacterium]
MEREQRYLNTKVEVRAEEGEKLTLTGYAIRYNEKSNVLGYGFEEIIVPGAFKESLKTRNILALNNHDSNQLLGTTKGNTLRLEDRADGLYFELDLLPSRKELYDLVKRGDIGGMSFGFTCTEENYKRNNDTDIREVSKGELFEISVVHTPAYPTTNVVATRSLELYKNFKEDLQMDNDVSHGTDTKGAEVRGMNLMTGEKGKTTEVRCYKPGEKLSSETSNVTVGHLIRAYVTGKGTEEEKRMLGAGSGANYLIPSKVSNSLIDLARESSFLLNNSTIVDMQNYQTVSVPRVVQDPTVEFKEKGEKINPSDPVFDEIKLDAKYIYGLVEIPLEIIQTGIGVEDKINQLLASAISEKMEKAALNGAVNGFEGIFNDTDILKSNITGATFTEISKGVINILNKKGKCNNIALSPSNAINLDLEAVTKDKYTQPPKFYQDMNKHTTTALDDNKIFMGDFGQVYAGILQDIRIDMSLEYGFDKGTVAIRIMWYGDVAVAQPKHLCLLSVVSQ